jgi:hypothetical protein
MAGRDMYTVILGAQDQKQGLGSTNSSLIFTNTENSRLHISSIELISLAIRSLTYRKDFISSTDISQADTTSLHLFT